jgi:hypothetical protein
MSYTFLQLQDEVLAHGFDSTQYRARIQRWLNEGQHLTMRRVTTRDFVTSSTVTTAAGTVSYSLPTDLDRIQDLVRTVDQTPVHPISMEWMDTLPPASGAPTLYALSDSGISFYPTPAGVYTLRLRYWKDAADMTLDTDTPTIPSAHQHVLVSYACSRAYRAEDDQERAASFMADYERGLVGMAADRRGEQGDGPKQVPGMWNQRHGESSGYR